MMHYINQNQVFEINVMISLSLTYFCFLLGGRRRKSSIDKSQTEEDDEGAKPSVADSSISPVVSTTTVEPKEEPEKPSISLRKPLAFTTPNGSGDEQSAKKKRGRKPKIETTDKDQITSIKSKGQTDIPNGNEIEYDYPQSTNRSDQQQSSLASFFHLIQPNNPPLSNYEQKQIVDGLLNHPNEKNLTFEEAQTYAINKAMEISKKFYFFQ